MIRKFIPFLILILQFFFTGIAAADRSGSGANDSASTRSLSSSVQTIERDFRVYLDKLQRDISVKNSAQPKKQRFLSKLHKIERQLRKMPSGDAIRLLRKISELRKSIKQLDQRIQNIEKRQALHSGRPAMKRPARQRDRDVVHAGSIKGKVTDSVSNAPIEWAGIEIYDSSGEYVDYGYTDSTGTYSVPVSNGTYYVATFTVDHFDELYDNLQCEPSCDVLTGTPIVVAGQAANANFALAPGGKIAGTIVSSDTHLPLANINVDIYDDSGNYSASGFTDENGHYESYGLLTTANYFAVANDYQESVYLAQLYENISCDWGVCNPLDGTPIPVTASSTTPNINFSLNRGGSISGQVIDAIGGSPITGDIYVYNQEGDYVASNTTNESGLYTVFGLPSGIYHVVTESRGNYIDELYDGFICYNGYCETRIGTDVAVVQGSDTPDIDFVLERGGEIKGQITDQLTSDPIPYAGVEIFDAAGQSVSYGYSDETGNYSSSGLFPGTYFALTTTYGDYLNELYEDIPCHNYDCDVLSGTPISVLTGAATDVSFALMEGGSIRGKVRSSANNNPIEGVSISIFNDEGYSVAYGYTNALGNYETYEPLPSGNYYALTFNDSGFIDELYNNRLCPFSNCDPVQGDPIQVNAGEITSNINFNLDRGGSISGQIINSSTSSPVTNSAVRIFSTDGGYVAYGYTNSHGKYEAGGLITGDYYVVSFNSERLIDELYNNIPCVEAYCDLHQGNPVSVIIGSITPDINFELDPGGSIGGKVTDEVTTDPIYDAYIDIYDSSGNYITYAYTDSTGAYESMYTGLSSGNYFATAWADYYNLELYDNIPCDWSCDVVSGTPIAVTAGAVTTGVDFSLNQYEIEEGGVISGSVVDQDTLQPIPYAQLQLYDSEGGHVSYDYSDEQGNYKSELLPPGNYFVVAYDDRYIPELYSNIECPAAQCDPTAGTPVSVSVGQTTTGINFSLTACSASEFAPSLLPEGVLGIVYNQTITVSGPHGPYLLEIVNGWLPGGLTFDGATGVISGVPTGGGYFPVTFQATDSNGCSSYWTYTIVIRELSCFFCDEFDDGVLSGKWTYKGNWQEMDGHMIASSSRKASAIASDFDGCLTCTVFTAVRFAGEDSGRIKILGWYNNKANSLELVLKNAENRWILRHRSDGKIVAKQKVDRPIDSGAIYNISIEYDGLNFVLRVDGEVIMTMPSPPPAAGTGGLIVRGTSAFFEYFSINR